MPHIWPEFQAYRDIAPWLKSKSAYAKGCDMMRGQLMFLDVLRSSGGSTSCALTSESSRNLVISILQKLSLDGVFKWMKLDCTRSVSALRLVSVMVVGDCDDRNFGGFAFSQLVATLQDKGRQYFKVTALGKEQIVWDLAIFWTPLTKSLRSERSTG